MAWYNRTVLLEKGDCQNCVTTVRVLFFCASKDSSGLILDRDAAFCSHVSLVGASLNSNVVSTAEGGCLCPRQREPRSGSSCFLRATRRCATSSAAKAQACLR